MKPGKTISNKTWAQLQVGDSATIERACSDRDLFLFAHVSGNTNPLMLPVEEGAAVADQAPIAPSMWVGSLISAVLGNILPGPGTLYREQNFEFLNRVHVGDRLRVTVTCREKRAEPTAVFDTIIANAKGEHGLQGNGRSSTRRSRHVEIPVRELPALIMEEKDQFLAPARSRRQLPRLKTVVVCPENHNSLSGAAAGGRQGPDRADLHRRSGAHRQGGAELEADLSPFRIIEEKNHRVAADKAVAMVRAGEAGAVMKGDLHSDDLLAAVVKKEGGLRTGAPDQPCLRARHAHPRRPAVRLRRRDQYRARSADQGGHRPERHRPRARLRRRAQGRRAVGGRDHQSRHPVHPRCGHPVENGRARPDSRRLVDGPLAMDNAIDMDAARTKGIASLVAGHANVLIAPNLESGNMLAKELTFVAHAEAAGLVVGASAPVMLTSRADNDKARLVSCALAQLYNYWRQNGHAFTGETADKKALAAE